MFLDLSSLRFTRLNPWQRDSVRKGLLIPGRQSNGIEYKPTGKVSSIIVIVMESHSKGG